MLILIMNFTAVIPLRSNPALKRNRAFSLDIIKALNLNYKSQPTNAWFSNSKIQVLSRNIVTFSRVVKRYVNCILQLVNKQNGLLKKIFVTKAIYWELYSLPSWLFCDFDAWTFVRHTCVPKWYAHIADPYILTKNAYEIVYILAATTRFALLVILTPPPECTFILFGSMEYF